MYIYIYIYYELLLVSLPNHTWKQQAFGIAYTLVCLLHMHDMPTFKSEAFYLVSKLQLVKHSSKGIHDTLCYFPYVILPGANAEQSYRNFFDWLYRVYEEKDLPCLCIIKGAKTQQRINGCFHRMSPDAALRLVQTIQVKLTDWGAACTRRNLTCGSVFVTANSGVGQQSLVQQMCGPFQD